MPAVGDMVLFHENPPHKRTRPAIVTDVSKDGDVSLLVFTSRNENAIDPCSGHWVLPGAEEPAPDPEPEPDEAGDAETDEAEPEEVEAPKARRKPKGKR